jgi:hypothetical protein
VAQADGTNFTVRWDVVTPQTLFTRFTASSLDGINPPNIAAIVRQLMIFFMKTAYLKFRGVVSKISH